MKYFINLNFCILLIFIFSLFSCNKTASIVSTQRFSLQISDSLEEDDQIHKLILPFQQELNEKMNEVLAFSPSPLLKDQPEGELGNFIADLALLEGRELYQPEDMIQIDFCLLNTGGLRSSLPRGEITRKNIFELMPFENELVVLTLSGENVIDLCNYIAENEGMPVSGLKMGIKNLRATKILINNLPLDTAKNYKIITSDYLAQGGDRMYFFKSSLKYENLNKKLRDAIIDYLIEETRNNNAVKSKKDGRIYYE